MSLTGSWFVGSGSVENATVYCSLHLQASASGVGSVLPSVKKATW
jgi:hypothetical protein